MIFNSVSFLCFLVAVYFLYWVLPHTSRLWMIFLASLSFYGFWRVEFIPLMLFSAFVDYSVSLAIYSSPSKRNRKLLLITAISVNLGLLFYFKYFYFFIENITFASSLFGFKFPEPSFSIILPLGISFYTFQTISYSVDVYRGFIKPERSFVTYGCYVTFFPQLIAGPILRAKEVIHQFWQRPNFNLLDLNHGLRWILYGLFLKVVLADNIAPLVDSGFSIPVPLLSAWDVWTLAFLFGFQIYFDFSAYSHIAIGCARLLGIHFPNNFFYPYLAYSPKEFWKRWHISLSSWVRDYLYLPLAGIKVQDCSTGGLAIAIENERKGPKRNLLLVLFLSWAVMGLWHGANWTFVLWGIYHAIFIFLYRLVEPLAKNWSGWWVRGLGWVLTLTGVMLSWIPFRTDNVGDALAMWCKIVSFQEYGWLGMRENTYLLCAVMIVSVSSTYFVRKWYVQVVKSGGDILIFPRVVLESIMFAVIISLVFVFLRPIQQFIYFQF